MYVYIQKALDWGVKIASLAITGPATWIVATELFDDIQNVLLLNLMRFAAVLLVEGVLLSNWLLLEFDVKATPEIKARYGLTALLMFGALAVIGWQHEGPTGIVFRLALLAALIGSGWDTYVHTWQRATANVDRSVENSRKVKRHARRLSIKEALLLRDAEFEINSAQIDLDRKVGLEEVRLGGERGFEGAELSHRRERLTLRRQLMELEQAEQSNLLELPSGVNGSTSALDGDGGKKNALSLATAPKASSRRSTASPAPTPEPQISDSELRQLILDAFADDPSITRTPMAKRFGVTTGRISTTVAQLIKEGLVIKDGNRHYVAEFYDTDEDPALLREERRSNGRP